MAIYTLKGTPAYRARIRALCHRLRIPLSFMIEDAISEYMVARKLTIGPPRLSGRRRTERRIPKPRKGTG